MKHIDEEIAETNAECAIALGGTREEREKEAQLIGEMAEEINIIQDTYDSVHKAA